MSAIPQIVIVGGGAGGLELATRLGHQLGRLGLAKIVLVDCSPVHIWKPLLHEVATGALNTGEDEVNYFAHAYHNGYEFEFGRMYQLDTQNRVIRLEAVLDETGQLLAPERSLAYDWLVMAVGAIPNDFGTPGVQQHALFLNSVADADRLRKALFSRTFSASYGGPDAAHLRIGIVGGGATGVELAAEIHHTVCVIHNYGGRLAPKLLNINLVEGADRILSGAPEALSHYATEQLEQRGIQVLTKARVAEVTAQGLKLTDGREVALDICVWAAGVKAPAWLKDLGLELSPSNQIKVNAYLQSLSDPRVLALGDCCWFGTEDGRSLPATAQVAHQQSSWLAKALALWLQGKQPKAFDFKPQGMMVSLGKHTAVGSLASVVGPKREYYVEGHGAKLIYMSLYRMHQAAVHGWFRTLFLFIGDKLRRVVRPALKLH